MKAKLLRILKFIGYSLAGLFCFYLILGFVIIPFALKWGIQGQGNSLLKRPVIVRSVQFNPFFLRLTIQGLEIRENDQTPILSFKKFFADVSFRELFKKTYRVENISLEDPYAKAVLSADGTLNFLALIPVQPTQEDQETQPLPESSPTQETQQAALPLTIIDQLSIAGGKIVFVDQSVTPAFETAVEQINIHMKNITTRPEDQAEVVLSAILDQHGKLNAETRLKPLSNPLELETVFHLNDYTLQVLTPYVGKYTGRMVKDGKLNLDMDYRISGNTLTASHKLLIQKFGFGERVESKDALNLPFGLAISLLEDPAGRIKIALPVSGDLNDPKFNLSQLITQTVTNFFLKLVTKPFSFLASMISIEGMSEEDLGFVRFEPGQTDLSETEKEKLTHILTALKERPKLVIEVHGAYDPQVDWTAIKKQAFEQEYEALKKESQRPEDWVLMRYYQRSFGVRPMWKLASSYRKKGGAKEYEPAFYQEIRRQLIENAPVDRSALDRLAAQRAEAVVSFFNQSGSLDQGHMRMGMTQQVQSSLGTIPLPLSLTVFE